MQHLSPCLRRENSISRAGTGCQTRVRFCALRRIKPHVPPLVRAPVNSFEFSLATVLPRRDTYCVSCDTQRGRTPRTSSIHRLQRGLPGYLILFAPHAFAPQRQSGPSRPLSPPIFLLISTNFTSTPGIPPAPDPLKIDSSVSSSEVEPRDFTPRLSFRLHALYAQ